MKQESWLDQPHDKTYACRHCNRKVDKFHIDIHQIRCVAKLNFARRKEQNQNKSSFSPILINQQQEQIQEIPKGIKLTVKGDRRKKQNSFRFSLDPLNKIPCTFCGQEQQLSELDTHPSKCIFRDTLCQDCQDSFPLALMDDHKQVCPNRRQQQRIQFHYGRFIEPELNNHSEGQDMEQSQAQSSIMIEEDRQPPRRRRIPLPGPFRMYQSSPGVFQSIPGSQQQGQLSNQQRFQRWRRGPLRLRAGERIPQRQVEDNSRRFSNLAAQFMNLINMLAQRQQQIEEGLNQEQIQKLNKVTYVAKSNDQKDLCTICYCDFQAAEKVIKLKCNHIYHPQCIIKWLQKNKKCPVCKCKQTNRQDEESEA